ncbi:MAG: iron ABC transporter permease, partial [Psychrobacter sp.]|nr:iron ABC transporter permease [Psychrobacter sp.]
MSNTVTASIPIQTKQYKKYLYYISAVAASLFLIWIGLGIGFGEWSNPNHLDETIWQLRYPRVMTALLVGMALSVSGA